MGSYETSHFQHIGDDDPTHTLANLYYQRIEEDPEGDTVASGGGGGGNAPSSSSGGGGAAGSRSEVKFNYVVYEGEMQDGMRDGRGICLYNNNPGARHWHIDDVRLEAHHL